MDFSRQTISGLSGLYQKNSCTQKEVLDSLSQAIQSKDRDKRQIHAYKNKPLKPIHRKADKKSKLWGVPIAIKDNICVEGEEITCSSKILQGFVSPYHATVIEKLLDAGAVMYGQTNMDEFAFGSSCETSFYGPTRNPRDPQRVPGGSSGGSAAAVADHTAIAALGSDTGGSIRQPASFCGVVGIKPTYGRVSRYGLIAFASSLDQIGPITKDVRDAAILLGAIAGHDPKDSTSADVSVPDYESFLGKDIKDMKIGYPFREFYDSNLSHRTKHLMENSKKVLEGLGAKFIDITFEILKYSANVYYIVAPSEVSSNLARFDGVRFGYRSKNSSSLLEMFENSRGEGFGAEAKRRIILGTYALSSGYYDAYYLKAMKVRTLIKKEFDDKFKEHELDAIMLPTSPSPAFRLGEKTKDPLEMYMSDIYTISANLTGMPAISLPAGFSDTDSKFSTKSGLPLGIQFLAKPFDEGNLFRLAYAFEQGTPFHKDLGNVS